MEKRGRKREKLPRTEIRSDPVPVRSLPHSLNLSPWATSSVPAINMSDMDKISGIRVHLRVLLEPGGDTQNQGCWLNGNLLSKAKSFGGHTPNTSPGFTDGFSEMSNLTLTPASGLDGPAVRR